jgi:RimJ/RimL family protein N-acetyltransferase
MTVYANAGLKTLVSCIGRRNTRSMRLAERSGARPDADAPSPAAADCLVYRHPGPEKLA